MAAYVPDKGQSLEDISEKYPQPEILKTFVKDDAGYPRISDVVIKKYFAADLSPEEQT